MGVNRIVYQEWIVALGRDPGRSWQATVAAGSAYNEEIILVVTKALEALPADEAAFIRSFYFQGLAYEAISRETGRNVDRLALLHRRALKSLIARLGTRFGERQAEDDVSHPDCPLCSHPARDDIERLLNTKRKEETWKRHLTILRQTYGMPHLTPRQIVGHRQYHRATGKIGVDPGANSAANIA